MTNQRSNWYAEIAVGVLLVALVILSIFLVRQYRVAARQTTISAERVRFADLVRHHSLGAADIGLIAPWMTFDYVSVSFKVPVAYLTSELGISSSAAGYPNITIGHYARTIATSSPAFTAEVQDAVRSYFVPPSVVPEPPSAASSSAAFHPSAPAAPQEE